MKRAIFILLVLLSTVAFGQKKVNSTKAHRANMTPEQRMVSSNKKGKHQSTQQKARAAKKQDKKARKMKVKKRK